MRRKIVRHDQAERDVDELAFHLARAAGRETAYRFLEFLDQAIEQLAEMPEIGTRCELARPKWAELRVWPVPRFKNHLIFYQPIENGIEVLRVLHSSRDIDAILGS